MLPAPTLTREPSWHLPAALVASGQHGLTTAASCDVCCTNTKHCSAVGVAKLSERINLAPPPCNIHFFLPRRNGIQPQVFLVKGSAPGGRRQACGTKKERSAPQLRLSKVTSQVSRAFTTVSPRSAAQARARPPVLWSAGLEGSAWNLMLKMQRVFSRKTGQDPPREQLAEARRSQARSSSSRSSRVGSSEARL